MPPFLLSISMLSMYQTRDCVDQTMTKQSQVGSTHQVCNRAQESFVTSHTQSHLSSHNIPSPANNQQCNHVFLTYRLSCCSIAKKLTWSLGHSEHTDFCPQYCIQKQFVNLGEYINSDFLWNTASLSSVGLRNLEENQWNGPRLVKASLLFWVALLPPLCSLLALYIKTSCFRAVDRTVCLNMHLT